MPPRVLGLDIGGANLKAADSDAIACLLPFAVWKEPTQLAAALQQLINHFHPPDFLAVTMTAELCDCFATKEEGVHAILDALVTAAAERQLDKQCIMVWQNDGQFVSVDEARRTSSKTAAANWLALATYVGELRPDGPAILVDVGSTTTDVIPIRAGQPVPQGRTDLERLVHQELLYEGVIRTPLCAVLPAIAWRGHVVRPAAELFATTLDAYLLLGDLPEHPDDVNTADGRPATRTRAHARLARMLCADVDQVTLAEAIDVAQQVKQAQWQRLAKALRHAGVQPDWHVYVTGTGAFLAREVAEALVSSPGNVQSVLSLTGVKPTEAMANATCAYALAMLSVRKPVAAFARTRVGRASPHSGECGYGIDYVIKVGGSLLDLPNLGVRLRTWLDKLPSKRIVLIAGGGDVADIVRRYDQTFDLGLERAHALALRAMELNSHLLSSIVPGLAVADSMASMVELLDAGINVIFDPRQELTAPEAAPLPENWDVTSDSIAAYFALNWRAKELILLKSRAVELGQSWDDLANAGLVDSYFPKLATQLRSVRMVNFRPVP